MLGGRHMGKRTKNRLLCCLACVLLLAGSVSAQSLTDEDRARFRDIFLMCRHPGGPMPVDDLRAYAQGHGFSDAEMAARLLAFAQEGLEENADAGQRRLARCAIGHLRDCGGKTEAAFLRKLMRETEYGDLRQAAALVGMRLAAEKWEEWFREAKADPRFEAVDRYLLRKAVFGIGRDGDEKTRRRVIEVLAEMRNGLPQAERNHVGVWIAELEGGDAWERWLRKVTAKESFLGRTPAMPALGEVVFRKLGVREGFYGIDHERACELAFRVGRDGDEATRQHVIDVLQGLLADGSYRGDERFLRRKIAELHKDRWEEWMRKTVSDERFGAADRFAAYALAARLVDDTGDEATRKRVVALFEEMLPGESDEGNRIALQGWLDAFRDNRPGTIRPCADTPDP